MAGRTTGALRPRGRIKASRESYGGCDVYGGWRCGGDAKGRGGAGIRERRGGIGGQIVGKG